ncbi:unnamed protein product, partial [Polarella glacialis]
RAIRGAGMHSLEDPNLRGNLFVLLRVLLPTGVDEDSAQLLREVLPSVAPGALEELSATGEELEEFELCDLDPMESQRLHHVATGGIHTTSDDRDEAPPAGAPGPPPCGQM